MKIVLLIFIFLLSSTSVFPQSSSSWNRVYTFDESAIDMNTSIVTIVSKDISRVRFRWTFNHPEVLTGEPRLTYTSRLEVMEFNCSAQRYRPYHITFYDAAGDIVRVEEMHPPADWLPMGRIYAAACELIDQRTHPPVPDPDEIELAKAAKYAFSISQNLAQTKDFKPIIEKFFAADFLKGYLEDRSTNWFLNLDRETAAKASRADLRRFYVALLNSSYWSSVYFISQSPQTATRSIREEELIPADLVELIDNHPYTARYKGKLVNRDYLAENIDSIERLKSYTDLLESIGDLMRKRVASVGAEHSSEYQAMLEDWDLYRPEVRTCASDCLGLPRGTRVFEVNVPVFHLQLAEIKGELRVVSVRDYFH